MVRPNILVSFQASHSKTTIPFQSCVVNVNEGRWNEIRDNLQNRLDSMMLEHRSPADDAKIADMQKKSEFMIVVSRPS